MKLFKILIFSMIIFSTTSAFAGDGATIIFREGQVAFIENGYATLVEEYKKLNSKESSHKILELKLESSPFLINLAEIVVICRDRCSSLEIIDPRRTDMKRSASN